MVDSQDADPQRLHVVSLEAPLDDATLESVARAAAPTLGVSVDRLRSFLARKGDTPLTRADDPEVAASFADALREAGAAVRIDVVEAEHGVDPGAERSVTSTWSDVAARDTVGAPGPSVPVEAADAVPSAEDAPAEAGTVDGEATVGGVEARDEVDPEPVGAASSELGDDAGDDPSVASARSGPRPSVVAGGSTRPRRSGWIDAFVWFAFLAALAGIAVNVLLYVDLL